MHFQIQALPILSLNSTGAYIPSYTNSPPGFL
uniref:Uncharacterized protein n=1 Tax=Anguilla anguilla TaxID=7936 RepID=A0A0E9V4E8_ANGAN